MITSGDLILVAAGVVLAGAFVMFVLVLLHGWWWRAAQRRYAQDTLPLRSWLLRAIQSPPTDPALARQLMQQPMAHRTRLLAEAGRRLWGEEKARVTRLAQETGVVREAKRWAISGRWWRRLQGVRVLSAVGGGEDLVPSLLTDASSFVRSEAALWCGDHGEPENIRRLLNLLDTPTLLDRIGVIDALVAIGGSAVEPLVERIPSASSEGKEAGLTAALGMGDPRFLPVARSLVQDPVVGVRKRAARLLSIIGGEEAVDLLEDLLRDAHPQVRATAARGLGDMRAWTAAGALEALLGDPEPDPSRDAALALADMGPAGWLLLRSCARSGGRAGRLSEAVLEAVEKTVVHAGPDAGRALS